MTGVSECSQQRGNLKDDGYIQSIQTAFLIQQKDLPDNRQALNSTLFLR
ncbi:MULTISPECIES: hypothetical protein [Photorhabdus]|nr:MULTISPECIES: hypothetical protein [Photorhabdus]NDL49366.1 hypothetical protein [Photorhabdus laumondii subsp. laumondii]